MTGLLVHCPHARKARINAMKQVEKRRREDEKGVEKAERKLTQSTQEGGNEVGARRRFGGLCVMS